MNEEQIIAETLKILDARPDNKKGFRHLQAVEWLKEIVVAELQEKPIVRSASHNFQTPMTMNPNGYGDA